MNSNYKIRISTLRWLRLRGRAQPDFRVIPGGKKRPEKRKSPQFLPLVLLAIIAFVIINALSYDDVVEKNEEGEPVLTPDRQAEIAGRQEKNRNRAEQYVLRAITSGFRECYLCPDGRIWLEAHEIAKIGISTNGKARYPQRFCRTHGVYYVTEYVGNLTTAKNKELQRLGTYPLLPENQKRKSKLVYPPLNLILD